MAETVVVPISLLQKLSEAGEAFRVLQEELEDFLISQDAELISQLERARSKHEAAEFRPFCDMRIDK